MSLPLESLDNHTQAKQRILIINNAYAVVVAKFFQVIGSCLHGQVVLGLSLDVSHGHGFHVKETTPG